MKRFKILDQNIPDPVKTQFGILILTLSHLEWFLQECLIFLILNQQFDMNNKGHQILANHIENLSFDRKVKLIGSYELLTDDLKQKLDSVRIRRNVFVHGIVIEKNQQHYISILKKEKSEDFTEENCIAFKNVVEETGGQLVEEFERRGFRLAG